VIGLASVSTYSTIRQTARDGTMKTRRTDTTRLIFDIGGTVFDWRTAMLEVLDRIVPVAHRETLEREAFTFSVRSRFLDLNGAVNRREVPWMTADQMLVRIVDDLCSEQGLEAIDAGGRRALAQAWRHMPAWPGAREAIARLRKRYIAAPLTILSWTMAVGSSRRNGIDWDSILSCDLLGVYKPDPRCYARAVEILDCTPGDIVMVAAHPSDLRAGMNAGYRGAYVRPRLHDPGEDYTDNGFADEFDLVAKDFGDLADQLLAA
jgi:2-haloacid dehalogenase